MNKFRKSGYQALEPGSDLWVVPVRNQSRWTRHIDWLCNLMILKFESRAPNKMSAGLEAILKGEELEALYFKPGTSFDSNLTGSLAAPLLLDTHGFVPNRHTLVLDSNYSAGKWIDGLLHIWENLKRPTTRFFFLNEQQAHDVEQFIKHKAGGDVLLQSFSWTTDQDFAARTSL